MLCCPKVSTQQEQDQNLVIDDGLDLEPMDTKQSKKELVEQVKTINNQIAKRRRSSTTAITGTPPHLIKNIFKVKKDFKTDGSSEDSDKVQKQKSKNKPKIQKKMKEDKLSISIDDQNKERLKPMKENGSWNSGEEK